VNICTEPVEGVWKCTCLGKVAEVSVTVRNDYEPTWHSGDFEVDDGGHGNMECMLEFLVPNACRVVCPGTECKSSLERGLVQCSIKEALLERAQLCSIITQ
jgi:hypothetical protein